MSNQYFEKRKIGVTGDSFIGREKDISYLMKAVDSDRPAHVSIYGLPHVGKSSLLREWTNRIKNNNECAMSGRQLFMLRGDSLDSDSEYTEVINGLIYGVVSSVPRLMEKGLLPETEEVRDLKELGYPGFVNPEDATETLRRAIKLLNENGMRVVLTLDEFEYAGNTDIWPEDAYLSFCSLLLDQKLDLFCVIVSRPHISYIVSNHQRRVAPFVPYPLYSFSDEDMVLFLERIKERGGPDLLDKTNRSDLGELISKCGKNPYLLTLAAGLIVNDHLSPREAYQNLRSDFRGHFNDVVSFMLMEEDRKEKSFTQIIKCYFGVSADSRDIIEDYIRLAYIEKIDIKSSFSFAYRHFNSNFAVIDEDTGRELYYYSTVSPEFIRYLFSDKVKYVRDVRDILTGLIYSVRDIIQKELNALYTQESWNEALLLKMRGRKYNHYDQYAINLPNNGGVAHLDLHDPGSPKLFSAPGYSPSDSFVQTRIQEIGNMIDFIDVDSSSLDYAVKEMNKGINSVMPVLDAINLTDTANIICHPQYRNLFQKYFMPGYDITQKSDRDKLEDDFSFLHKVRNPISHYSRHALSKQDKEECRKICIRLISGIYSDT